MSLLTAIRAIQIELTRIGEVSLEIQGAIMTSRGMMSEYHGTTPDKREPHGIGPNHSLVLPDAVLEPGNKALWDNSDLDSVPLPGIYEGRHDRPGKTDLRTNHTVAGQLAAG